MARKVRVTKAPEAVNPEQTTDMRCRKRRKLCELSFKERMEIAHKYLIEHYKLADVAVLYQVKPATIR